MNDSSRANAIYKEFFASDDKPRFIRELRALLIKKRGGACEICGSTETLWFAHLVDNELSEGGGRGRIRRYVDFIIHPNDYAILCSRCHPMIDYLGDKLGRNIRATFIARMKVLVNDKPDVTINDMMGDFDLKMHKFKFKDEYREMFKQ